MSEALLNNKIKNFYDRSSGIWEKTWGRHMHHGYYGNGKKKSDAEAQIDLIEELLKWGEVKDASKILDAGCGIGGSSIYLAKKFNAKVTGLTLSPVQAQRARELTEKENLSHRINFKTEDILNYASESGQYDLIWSLESAEHFTDKRKFMKVCMDLLVPGGKLLMATWCHRNVPPILTSGEANFLKKLYKAYHLPYIISIDGYEKLAQEAGFSDISSADWTEEVAPFWNAVRRSALHPKALIGIAQAGMETIRGAIAMNLMIKGYRKGVIRFGVLKMRKLAD